MHICICVCTYKRNRLLKKLLLKLARQETAGEFTYSVVVAENDREQLAKAVVDEIASSSPIPIRHCVEPRQNIAMARNKAVTNAYGDFIAFIDDDEFPSDDWLLTAFRTCIKYNAEGVLGPVRPFFEHQPPVWVVKGRFWELPDHPTGYRLRWREASTSNVLLRRRVLDGIEGPFRHEFGSGGEDHDFFKRLMERGAVFLWCNEAIVHELVPPERWRRRYLLQRALQRGQAAKELTDLFEARKSLLAIPLYALMAPFLLLAGQHRFMRCMVSLCDHVGMLLGRFGYTPMGDKYLS